MLFINLECVQWFLNVGDFVRCTLTDEKKSGRRTDRIFFSVRDTLFSSVKLSMLFAVEDQGTEINFPHGLYSYAPFSITLLYVYFYFYLLEGVANALFISLASIPFHHKRNEGKVVPADAPKSLVTRGCKAHGRSSQKFNATIQLEGAEHIGQREK